MHACNATHFTQDKINANFPPVGVVLPSKACFLFSPCTQVFCFQVWNCDPWECVYVRVNHLLDILSTVSITGVYFSFCWKHFQDFIEFFFFIKISTPKNMYLEENWLIMSDFHLNSSKFSIFFPGGKALDSNLGRNIHLWFLQVSMFHQGTLCLLLNLTDGIRNTSTDTRTEAGWKPLKISN